MRRIRASCWASFWPKNAAAGLVRLSSLATTVSMPSKWPGRDAPSYRSPIGPAAILTWGAPPGYTSSASGAKTMSAPASWASSTSASRVRG